MEDIERVKSKLPRGTSVADAKYEGSDIVLYVDTEDFFVDHHDRVSQIVSDVKKRVHIRPSKDLFKQPETARARVKELCGDHVEEMIFQPELGKVIIRTGSPERIDNPSKTREIREETLWKPQVERTPAIDSKYVNRARELTVEDPEFRKEFLNEVGEKIRRESDDEEWVRVSSLGGFRQVGRSCVLVQSETSNVLLDCGIDPSAEEGSRNNFPHLDAPELDIPALDAVVLSHAHMDHMGMIPYLYRMGYDGPLYCTAPTRDLMIMQTLDYIDISHSEQASAPYESKHIKQAVKRTITPEYGKVTDVAPDIKLTLRNSGHIIGSSIVHMHIGDGLHNLLYTGDYNYDDSHMLRPASTDFHRVETVITESTYGGRDDEQQPRNQAQKQFLSKMKQTLAKGGKVIVPAFAVGRSQEILGVMADELSHEHFDATVYLDGMIRDANALHTAYPEYLSKKIQKKIFAGNSPFTDDQIRSISSHEERKQAFEDPSCVVLTTSGMVTGGPIMSYLKKEASRSDNTLIFVGYQADGTLGRRILNGANQVEIDGERVEVDMNVENVSGFSAHSDREQIKDFVRSLDGRADHVFCNHGETKKCFQLASSIYKSLNVSTSAPDNLEVNRLN
nr:MAG: putative metal-dependent Rnase [Candidatus Nanosalinarum sp. J07AB56]